MKTSLLSFILLGVCLTGCTLPSQAVASSDAGAIRPNIILIMADDMGWGDTGYNGHPSLQTPHLDAMAAEGITFTRFYAAAPVCSPTRGSCLTGRHPFRYGITFANTGHMLPEELTLAELLGELGYNTGHFGKWHLGTLTTEVNDANRGGPQHAAHYAPPWDHGFDSCFSTESKVPTWDPMVNPDNGAAYGTRYWAGPGEVVTENLEGDDSRVIMDRVIPFIESAVDSEQPFFTVVWFHTPHLPVVAGPAYLAMYEDEPGQRPHYYGCITAMDEQIGRLRETLDELGAAENTLVFFCSDNGPEGNAENDDRPGSAGGLRGRKRSLYEGGIRVPGVMIWPSLISEPMMIEAPCCTSDYLPTILDILDIERIESRGPIDGLSLLPILTGAQRGPGIGFRSRNQSAWITDRYKIISPGGGKPFELYDLLEDTGEQRDLGEDHPAFDAMRADLESWSQSVDTERAE